MNAVLLFKLRAFLGHIVISLIMALLSAYIVYGVWHPAPFAKAVGVSKIFVMMLTIDVILGPILTFVVAKPQKKPLKFDLTVIAVLQLCALLYGLYSVEKGRPVWIAFDYNRFELVQKFSIDNQNDKSVPQAYQKPNLGQPVWVAVRTPKNDEEQSNWMMYEIEKGISAGMRPALYEPIDRNIPRIIKQKLPLSDLEKFNDKQAVSSVLAQYPNADGFLPMRASQVDMTVLVDSQDRDFLQVVDLRPW